VGSGSLRNAGRKQVANGVGLLFVEGGTSFPVPASAGWVRSGQVLSLRSNCYSPDLKARLGLLEACRLVERERGRLLRTSHQHNLVALRFPGALDGRVQNGPPEACSPMIGMGDDVLDQRIRLPAAGQVRDYDERAGRDKHLFDRPHEDDAALIAYQVVKEGDGVLGRAAHIVRVEVDVQVEKTWQVGPIGWPNYKIEHLMIVPWPACREQPLHSACCGRPLYPRPPSHPERVHPVCGPALDP
jgi:hypothetical protein